MGIPNVAGDIISGLVGPAAIPDRLRWGHEVSVSGVLRHGLPSGKH